jgi:hypothetical protein
VKSELQESVEIHNRYAHHTPLSKTIGDGFLYATNPIFRRVRDMLVSQNYSFYNELSEYTSNYFMTCLFQLDTILFEKKLFARHNFPALEKLIQKFPDKEIRLADVALLECYSTLLHESVHCICQQYFKWHGL